MGTMSFFGKTSTGLGGPLFPDTPTVTPQSAPQVPKSFIENPDLNSAFGIQASSRSQAQPITRGITDVFMGAGLLPAKIYESPVSVVDTLSRRLGLSQGVTGAVGNTAPGKVLGAVAGGLGEVANRSWNFTPAILNSGDAKVWSAVFDLPNNTPITQDLLDQRLGEFGWNPARPEAPRTGGVPILGALPFIRYGFQGHPQTVGEFKAQLAQRGFFVDDKGVPVDPTALGEGIRNGMTSAYDLGHASINNDPAVDLAGRLAGDPSNLLFLVPGADIAKAAEVAGRIGAKVLPFARAVDAGLVAEKLATPLEAAAQIERGTSAISKFSGATLKGVATFFKTYKKVSYATYGGLLVESKLGSSPAMKQFAQEALDEQPLSKNTAFMLLSAMTFTGYRDVAQGIKSGVVGRGVSRIVGKADLAPLYRQVGGRQKFLDAVGGPDGEQAFFDHLDASIALKDGHVAPAEFERVKSAAEFGGRLAIGSDILTGIVKDLRDKGLISPARREAEAIDWAVNQAGYEPKGGGRALFTPEDWSQALSRWPDWHAAMDTAVPAMREWGAQFLPGLREPSAGAAGIIFREQLDLGQARLKSATYTTAEGAKRVPKAVIREFLEKNPNINALDHKDYWAKFSNPHIPDPSWDSVVRKIASQRKDAVRMDEWFADFQRAEKDAPRDPVTADPLGTPAVDRINALQAQLEEVAHSPGNGNLTIAPENVARAQALQLELEKALTEQKAITDAKVARNDIKQGIEPDVMREAEAQATEALGEVALPPMAPGMNRLPPDAVAAARQLEHELSLINPSFTVKRSPAEFLSTLLPEHEASLQRVEYYNALGRWLFESGPGSRLANFFYAVTRPITPNELVRDQKQALRNELLPLGVKPKQADAILSTLEREASKPGFNLGSGGRVRIFRDVGSLLPSHVNATARDVLNLGRPKGDHPAIAKMEAAGGFYRILNRASSRYHRTLEHKVIQGDKAAAGLYDIYHIWNDAPVFNKLATGQRIVAKTFYPLFRFSLDPRWLMLNVMDTKFLTASKDGYLRAYSKTEQATNAAQFLAGDRTRALNEGEAVSGGIMPDTGGMLTRPSLYHELKSFDVRSAESVGRVLNEMGEQSPAIVAVREGFARDAESLKAQADKQFADGAITAEDLAGAQARASHLQNLSTRDMATELNNQLYAQDKKGFDTAFNEQVAQILSKDEFDKIRPLVRRVHEVNKQTYADVQSVLHGNANRNSLERLMNSYWFFWPLSYQIKATKWLGDIMLSGAFGHDTNALLAGKYALWQQQQQDRMAKDPSYRAMLARYPELWFVAQMVLPMTPNDIGVSLSRPTDYAGTGAQSFINNWLGTDIGLFTADSRFKSPTEAVRKIFDMGPIYSGELLAKFLGETVFYNPPKATSAATSGGLPVIQ
jgi:hypothetical protein